ncbi:ABC transporter ATP-binding protein [Pelagivirga sediminicola]|uniref:ABC transporter ATP-binding protein n=1 Tax=Pelagivirga sediminicola TaxID=2170575 RepID=A0A2T7G987_9RHOB|nr:ABC transporter ATP-binding protein [Pelagivirga sediminicola]PVA10966.1 ABC transporter ATP-binding protein [Pelagivirga sediminicola]
MSDNTPLLVTENLEKSFGGVVAAGNISISVGRGEQVAIIGSNGAGKTTFVNMVTGYLTPSAGSIRYLGRDITGLNPRQTARAGIRRSFQIAQLFPQMTALENMIITDIAASESKGSFRARSLTDARMDAAMALLKRFGLEGIANEPAGTLPQGVRKQLDIAMAAVNDPALILLDEPTSGVSADEKMEMMDSVIQPLLSDDATLMFIEHDMDIVRRYARRVIAFYEGQILIDGSVEEVLADDKVRQYVIGGVAHA